jgi:hypothetical protein
MSGEVAEKELMDLFGALHRQEITPEQAMEKFEGIVDMMDDAENIEPQKEVGLEV